ncbi:11204_t:CDS:1, partial [Entrophospora sp. SA101]
IVKKANPPMNETVVDCNNTLVLNGTPENPIFLEVSRTITSKK